MSATLKDRSMVWLTPSLGGGGAERTIVNLADAFHARGARCTIGVLAPEQAYETNAAVERVRGRGTFRPELWPWSSARELRALERRVDSSCTVSFMPLANLLNARAVTRQEPRYLSIRTTLSRALFGPTGGVYRRLMRHYYPRATKIVAISRYVADDAIAWLSLDPAQVTTIYNPIPIEQIIRSSEAPLDEPWESHLEERFTLVSVGRLSAEKGHALLLHVVAALKRRAKDCRLILFGRGAREQDYFALAQSLGLSASRSNDTVESQRRADVVFAGFTNNPYRYMRRADAFAFPSALEGLGQSLMEAVACGASIVASDCDSGPREILAPESDYRVRTRGFERVSCGWLAPPPSVDWREVDVRTVEEWVSALEDVESSDPGPRETARIRANDFAVAPIVDEWTRMLDW